MGKNSTPNFFSKKILSFFVKSITGDYEDPEGTVDVHPLDDNGHSALTIQVLSQVKLERAEQTFKMKKQNVAANDAKKEQMEISELIKLMLMREKEQHGHSKGILVLYYYITNFQRFLKNNLLF